MPNDARLGLLVGMVAVIAMAIIYRGQGTNLMPGAQVPGPSRTMDGVDGASTPKPEGQPVIPSLASRKEASGNDLGGKKDPADRVDGEPNSSDQPDDKQ